MLELVETHIAVCVDRAETTLEATSVASRLHVLWTVGNACYVSDNDNIPFYEQDVSQFADMHCIRAAVHKRYTDVEDRACYDMQY